MKECHYNKYACVFKALSDETRLKLCCLVAGNEACGEELLREVEITQPTLSYHMKVLCSSGLVKSRKDGTWTRYTINEERISELEDFINNLKTNH